MAYYMQRVTVLDPLQDPKNPPCIRHITQPFLSKGYLSLGYGEVTKAAHAQNVDIVALAQNIRTHGSRDDSDPNYRKFVEVYQVGWKSDPLKGHLCNLLNFLGFQPRDIALVPLDGGIFSIYQIDSLPMTNYSLDQKLAAAGYVLDFVIKEDGFWEKLPDGTQRFVNIGFFVRAHLISSQAASIPRSELSPELRSRLAYPRANKSCDDFADEIYALVKKYTSANSAP